MSKRARSRKTKSSAELSGSEKALIDSLIATLETVDQDSLRSRNLNPQLVVALLERLPLDSPRTPGLLAGIAKDFENKEVKKAIRRTLFRLKQRGIPVAGMDLDDQPVFHLPKIQQEKPEAYVGPIDGTGSRPILVAIPQLPQGVGMGMGVINDEGGILEYAFGRYSKKQAKEMQALFFEKLPFMVETSLSHATALLEEAHSLRAEMGEASGDYPLIREWLLSHVPPHGKLPMDEILSPESVSKETPTDSQIEKLLAHPLLSGWIAKQDMLESVANEIAQAERSPILLSGMQKVERINQIKEDSVRRLYPEKQRHLMKRRLEEMAYVFFKLGEEPLARICLRCASSLLERDSLLKVNPFLKALLEKSLILYFSVPDASATPGGKGPLPSRILVP